MVRTSNDFFDFVKENNLEWCYDLLISGFEYMGAANHEDMLGVYKSLMDSVKRGLEKGDEESLDVFSGVVNPVIMALGVFCEALDEYLEYSVNEDNKIVDGFYN